MASEEARSQFFSKIPTRKLGVNGPEVSSIGLGTMSLGGNFYGVAEEDANMRMLTHAADRGMTFWDCADIYGTSYVATTELTLAKWFKATNRRSEIFLATKFGGWDPEGIHGAVFHPISQPSYILYALERSLRRLETPYIDIYFQHRVDPSVPIEIVLETLRPAVESGKIRWLGLSECSVETLRRAKAVKGLGERVIAAQMELSPWELEVEKSGFAQIAEELGVALVTYSPLGHGMTSGRFRSLDDFAPDDFRRTIPRFQPENFSANVKLADRLRGIADKYKATASQITLAWILAESPNYIPIPGCRTFERVEENANAADIKLAPEDVQAIRALVESADVRGTRYHADHMLATEGSCIPLDEWHGEA